MSALRSESGPRRHFGQNLLLRRMKQHTITGSCLCRLWPLAAHIFRLFYRFSGASLRTTTGGSVGSFQFVIFEPILRGSKPFSGA